MADKKEKPIVIELYELWNTFKARFNIVSPQPKSFTLDTIIHPVVSIGDFLVRNIDLSDDTSVAAAANITQTLQPAAGKIWEIQFMAFNFPDPAGSATGDHKMQAMFDLTLSHQTALFYLTSDFGTDIKTYNGEFSATTDLPGNVTLQYYISRKNGLCINHDTPLYFRYWNGTDVAAALMRTIKILVKEYNEA